ncbi:MAG: hypothetical protein RI911_236, partial [Candidatus Parcubacteria bacterium]
MFDSKELVAYASIILTIIAYIPYIRDTWRGKTQPHVYSWLIWTIGAGVVCMIQAGHNAGPGAWVTGALFCMLAIVTIMSLQYGTTHVSRSDTLCFLGALLALVLWTQSDY